MNLDLKTRIVRLGMKQKDIAKMLDRPGFIVTQSELSIALNNCRDFPKYDMIRNELKNLLTKLEHERGIE